MFCHHQASVVSRDKTLDSRLFCRDCVDAPEFVGEVALHDVGQKRHHLLLQVEIDGDHGSPAVLLARNDHIAGGVASQHFAADRRLYHRVGVASVQLVTIELEVYRARLAPHLLFKAGDAFPFRIPRRAATAHDDSGARLGLGEQPFPGTMGVSLPPGSRRHEIQFRVRQFARFRADHVQIESRLLRQHECAK